MELSNQKGYKSRISTVRKTGASSQSSAVASSLQDKKYMITTIGLINVMYAPSGKERFSETRKTLETVTIYVLH